MGVYVLFDVYDMECNVCDFLSMFIVGGLLDM